MTAKVAAMNTNGVVEVLRQKVELQPGMWCLYPEEGDLIPDAAP